MSTFITPMQVFSVLSPGMVLAYWWGFARWVHSRNNSNWEAAQQRQQALLDDAATAVVPKALLTNNEKEFFGRLRKAMQALPLEVVPQVSMGALLDVNLPEDHPLYWKLRNQFSQKIIDFVVYSRPNMDVVAVIELDDKTHDVEKDARRDALMAKAGFKTIRWDSRAKPNVETITKTMEKLLPGSAASL